MQTNPGHKHYGCVAFVECGLLIPRYIHGDYDLYAIIPAGRPFDTGKLNPRAGTLGSTMTPDGLSLEQRLRFPVPNLEGPLSFRVASFINNRIAATSPDFLGALMVNHGEQVNLGTAGQTFEPVLAFLPRPENGSWTKVLASRADHENFYRNA